MKQTLIHAAAALLATSAVALVFAQASDVQPTEPPAGQRLSNANIPTATPDVTSSAAKGEAAPAMPFVDEPIASAMKADGPDADKVNAIVQALNADASLKNSKITVQTDNDIVLLTGAALNAQQVQRATEIARSSGDNAMVVNVVQPDHIDYKAPQA